MDRPLYSTEEKRPSGLGAGILLSLTIHAALLAFAVIRTWGQDVVEPPAPVRFVELVPQPALVPSEPIMFTEAPGTAVQTPPRANALYSDANRRASAPRSTGSTPTATPGDGNGLFVPGGRGASQPAPPPQPPAQQAAMTSPSQSDAESRAAQSAASNLEYRDYQAEPTQAAASSIDWRSAIRDVGRIASLDGGFGGQTGGDLGFAESGPISFETQWYDWGPYAAAMVAKIRLHWYQNMPEVIRLGLKGVVTVRFTIQRDGNITNLELLSSSQVPPYDHAAQKAIALASPLGPLPSDFPGATERVTAQFYYNLTPPKR